MHDKKKGMKGKRKKNEERKNNQDISRRVEVHVLPLFQEKRNKNDGKRQRYYIKIAS